MTDLNNTPAPVAPVAKTFTVASLARELKVDEKVARRKMRANVARETPAKTPKVVAQTSRKNARYEYTNTDANRALITAIIKG